MVKKGKSKRKQKKIQKGLFAEKGIQNTELGKAMRDLRSSNAAVPHTLKPLKGTRSDKKKKSIFDSFNQ